MPQIGPLEVLIVGVLALIVFGPDKLPEMARSVGKGIVELKRMASDVKSEFDLSLHDQDQEQAEAEATGADEAEAPDDGAGPSGSQPPATA